MVGTYRLANRIMNTGHAAHFQTGDGLPTRRYVDYVRERARGGAGIIVTGHTVPYYDGDAALSLRLLRRTHRASVRTYGRGDPRLRRAAAGPARSPRDGASPTGQAS